MVVVRRYKRAAQKVKTFVSIVTLTIRICLKQNSLQLPLVLIENVGLLKKHIVK